MTPKERFLRVLDGKKTDIDPVAIHGWGLYKFAMEGIITDYSEEEKAWNICGKELAEIEVNFYNTFKPDWMHLSEAYFDDIKNRINKKDYKDLLQSVQALDSKQCIDEFMELIYLEVDELEASGKFDHVKILSDEYGDEIFIALHTAAPICDIADATGILGFEDALVAMINKPDMFRYLAGSMYEKQLNFVKALKRCGAHCYIQSEAYVSSDLVSPETYKNILFDIQKNFNKEVKKIGLIPMCYFVGDIVPILKYISRINIEGLLIEESKKDFRLDIGEIIKGLNDSVALFGNVDSVYTLLKGSEKDVETEVKEQLKNANEANSNKFISNLGSPIPFNTPVENIKTYIKTAREYKRQ